MELLNKKIVEDKIGKNIIGLNTLPSSDVDNLIERMKMGEYDTKYFPDYIKGWNNALTALAIQLRKETTGEQSDF